MEWLNYHHLLYFWVVAKEGSLARASQELRLAHPTISGQIHRLEEALGEQLFTRQGRNLVLTEVGRVAFRYADGEPHVIKDLNLVVPPGQCIAISGASGCGKTTLIKLLLGLLEPTEGLVQVFGCSPLKQTTETLPRLGFVAQNHPLYMDFTVAIGESSQRADSNRRGNGGRRTASRNPDRANARPVGS